MPNVLLTILDHLDLSPPEAGAKGTFAKRQVDLTIEATAESLNSTARVLERVVAVAGESLAGLQRGQDGAVREQEQGKKDGDPPRTRTLNPEIKSLLLYH